MNIKPDKNQAIKAAVQLTPQYAEWISCLQKDNSKIFPDAEIVNIQNNVGKYVLMYDDERKIGRSLFLTLLGKEGWEELNTELENASDAEKQEWLDDMANPNNNELAELFDAIEIPSTPEGWRLAREAAEKLPEDVREKTKKQGTYFWCFVFSSFFNTLSLMIHGARLTL